ncbi:MAG TPA: hypothetical protein VMN99_05715, partial [Anaerolineales bacterium]|nr:hypothetical protein [Anaerolineales bacterium]
DLVFVQNWLEQLQGIIGEMERRLERIPPAQAYRRGSLSQFQPTGEKQIESLRQLYGRMQEFTLQVTEFIGFTPATPLAEIETLLALTHE